MFCKNCGKQLNDEVMLCECGTEANIISSSDECGAKKEEVKSDGDETMGIIVSFAVIMIILTGMWMGTKSYDERQLSRIIQQFTQQATPVATEQSTTVQTAPVATQQSAPATTQQSTPRTSNADEPIVITAQALFDAYTSTNPARADLMYTGRRVQVTGVIGSINRRRDNTYSIRFRVTTKPFSFDSITAYLLVSENEKVAWLETGRRVTVIGTASVDSSFGVSVNIRHAVIR